ncbi:MAG TPA: class I SAM-dependent DNA methyltransferase [Acidimicrobiales bacterium]|nr:class I SAM-dependent DNA methyltransferase [Acidimicrobiales bacterium]
MLDNFNDKVSFIWSVADLLRGDYKQSEYGRVILPLVVLRRLDCVLAPTKSDVLSRVARLPAGLENVEPVLKKAAGHEFYNVSKFDLPRLLDDPNNVADNLKGYIAGFFPGARDVLHRFGFDVQIDRLVKAGLLYLVVSRFCDIDLHPDVVSNTEMGYLYEELVRRFSEQSNETAGEHFTPREVIRLMVNLLFVNDEEALARPGVIRTLYDPACGTGGMLSVAEEYLRQLNSEGQLRVFGQELNDETFAVCRSDMMLKGHDAENIYPGNSFTHDGLPGHTFHYMLANPPFGVEWKKVADQIKAEHETRGFGGRFGAGLPRINDGSLLFLQHMLSKMKPPSQGGSRLAIVFNGSPLFTGGAGSGESEIRRWIIENDWLEAVVALPDQLFYNTGISTYFWVLTNRKAAERRGKVQLVDGRDFWTKMRRSLGEKRKQISPEQITEITHLYADFTEGERVKIFPNESFGHQRITVERLLRRRWDVSAETLSRVRENKAVAKLEDSARDKLLAALSDLEGRSFTTMAELVDALFVPLADLGNARRPVEKAVLDALAVRDPDAIPLMDKKGNPEPDPELRDHENVPLPAVHVRFEPDPTNRLASAEYLGALEEYIRVEVLPFVSDAWIDHTKTRIGYEIPVTRHFYKYAPSRPLEEIDAEIKRLEEEIQSLLNEVTE